MDPVNSAMVVGARLAAFNTVQNAASASVLKRAMNSQAANVAQLVESLPTPTIALSGTMGTRVNTVA